MIKSHILLHVDGEIAKYYQVSSSWPSASTIIVDHYWILTIITLWLFNIAMENCLFIDDLPIKNGDFPWLW